MPSSEDCIAARKDVERRCITQFVAEGHPRHSAVEIVKYMTYEEQCEKIGQKRYAYSPY